jgi:hypothetical protein
MIAPRSSSGACEPRTVAHASPLGEEDLHVRGPVSNGSMRSRATIRRAYSRHAWRFLPLRTRVPAEDRLERVAGGGHPEDVLDSEAVAADDRLGGGIGVGHTDGERNRAERAAGPAAQRTSCHPW